MVLIQLLLGMLADKREGIKGTDKREGTTHVQFLQWSSVASFKTGAHAHTRGRKGLSSLHTTVLLEGSSCLGRKGN